MADIVAFPIQTITYCQTITGKWHRVTNSQSVANCGYQTDNAIEWADRLPAWLKSGNAQLRQERLCSRCFPEVPRRKWYEHAS